MNIRKRSVITPALLCHLFLACCLLTSGLRAQNISATEGEPVTISAREQEKTGPVYKLHGEVEIDFRNMVLRGDEITYNTDTGDVTATGHLIFDGGPHDEQLEASHGEFNAKTQTGKFYDVVGTTGVRFRGRNLALTTSDPFAFTGKMVEKTGPDHFIVHHGTVTSCRMPDPKWTFNAERVDFEVGGTAKIYESTLRIKKVPVLFLPYARHPVDKLGRQSGFLVPTFGASSRKGTIIGDSFYWAINRSMDTTLGVEYYSSRGWAQHGDFRAKPSEHSYVDLNYFGVMDRGFGPTKIDQGGQDIKLNAEAQLPHDIRAVASLNYLSSFVFRLAFAENFSQAVNSEVKSLAFLSKGHRNFFLNAMFGRYQNFQSATRGDLITIVHAQSIEANTTDHRFLNTPFYFRFDGAVEGLSRREPLFKTDNVVGRFDVHPRASLPLFLHGWMLRSEVGLRNTYYTQRKTTLGAGTPVDDALNRRAIEASMELRPPTIGRIFEKKIFGRTRKPTIQPRVSYNLGNGGTGFQNTIRFDARDILSDTSELEYAFTQRLFAKKNEPCKAEEEKCEPGPREFITWEVVQRYYFDPNFGGSVVVGKRNVLATTADLTGIAFLTEPRTFSPIISKLRARATTNLDAQWEMDYDSKKGRINANSVFMNYKLGDYFLGGSHIFFHAPGEIFVNNPIPAPDVFNQFRVLAGYGGPNKRGWNSAASIGFDEMKGFLQYGSWQSAFNWDCCGISMEYRRFALGRVRNENQFRFAFTLANIGTFGNMKRQEKLFSGPTLPNSTKDRSPLS